MLQQLREEDVWSIYDKGDKLGEGAYGSVWIAESVGHEYACKTLEIQHVDNWREIKLMLQCSHPNLVKTFEVFQPKPKTLQIVMELMPDGDLMDYVRAPPPRGMLD